MISLASSRCGRVPKRLGVKPVLGWYFLLCMGYWRMTDIRHSWALGMMIWFLLRTGEQELGAFLVWNFLRDVFEAESANLSAGSWELSDGGIWSR